MGPSHFSNPLQCEKMVSDPVHEDVVGSLERGASFWLDNWSGLGPLKTNFPVLFSMERKKDCRVVERFRSTSQNFQLNWDWRTNVQSTEAREQLQICQNLLTGVRLNNSIDKWSWGSDDFTVNKV
ncbi:hypothetical protein QVD17_08494 [Tagetes erecta]|uniref:Uncharacterized protein n=1 Tax=Tagetes erecta TaxID=13708 RepID=A0AAD8KY17_TARER|nr:hypothetical protein QVD17_08494 [Tagetes erecta]